jgi:hypothetical protein
MHIGDKWGHACEPVGLCKAGRNKCSGQDSDSCKIEYEVQLIERVRFFRYYRAAWTRAVLLVAAVIWKLQLVFWVPRLVLLNKETRTAKPVRHQSVGIA